MATTARRSISRRHRPFDALTISDRLAARIRWVARIWVIIAASVFVGQGLRVGVPTHPDLGNWQEPVQFGLLLLVAFGGMLAWRWEAFGATVIVVGAIFIGVLATVESAPQLAFVTALVFLVPGVLFWFVWQRTQPFRVVVGLATVLLILLASGGYASSTVYNYLFGPTHPQSATIAPPVDLVEWVWSGAASQTSITVNAKLAHDHDHVRLAVSEWADMSAPVYSLPEIARDKLNQRVVSLAVTGLTPDTPYFYAIEAAGQLDLARRGQFTTFPDGAASFAFAFSSCARTVSNGQVFDAIRETEALFYLNTGDIHYSDISGDDPDLFRDELDRVLTHPAQAALYRSRPTVYVWDDHDYGSNDGDRTSPTREAARLVYQQYVPHYDLAAGTGDVPIYQAFTVGRVRFIVTDTRSERDPAGDIDDDQKSLLGDVQKAWFKQQLIEANRDYPVIVWVNSDPWIDPAGDGKDSWGAYATERRELADFIADNDIRGLLMLSGDAHMIAIDDGTHADYSTSQTGGFPVFHAAPLDNRASVKGGPYSEGTSAKSGQFGLVSVTDDGGDLVTVTLSGRNYRGEEVLHYRFSVPARAVR
jgi:phosphodiesterase/alkaline phosphatase D-like protein